MADKNRIDFEAFLSTQKFLKELDKIDKRVASIAKKMENSFTPALQKANKEVKSMQEGLDRVQATVAQVSKDAKSMAASFRSAASAMNRAGAGGSSRRAGSATGGPGSAIVPYGPTDIVPYGGAGSALSPYSSPSRGYSPFPRTVQPPLLGPGMGWNPPINGSPTIVEGVFSEVTKRGPLSGFSDAIDGMLKGMGGMDKAMAGLGERAKGFLGTLSGRGGIVGALGDAGMKLFGMAEGAGMSASAMGAVAVAAGGIGIAIMAAVKAMQLMIKIAKDAFQAFMDITDQAKEAAIQIDTARSGFEALFEGSEQMAEASFSIIREKSREMGADLTQLGRAFLPEMTNLAEFDKLAEVSAALAAYDPAQGAYGVNLALKDAMTGDFRSLRQRLEFSVPETDRIRAHMEANGNSIISMLDAIEVELERKGRSWEAFADTYAVQLGRVQMQWQYLKEEMGEPILETQKEGFRELADQMEENSQVFVAFGQGIGRIRSYLEEMKLAFYEGIIQAIVENKGQIAAYLEYAEQLVYAFREVGLVVIDVFSSAVSRSDVADGGVMRLFFQGAIFWIKEFAKQIIGVGTLAKNFFEMIRTNVESTAVLWDPTSTIEERAEALKDIISSPIDLVGDSFEEAQERFEEFEAGMDSISETWKEAMSEMGDDANAFAEELANAFLEMQAAEQILAQAQADMEAMTEEFRDEMVQLNRDLAHGIQDSFIQMGRDLIDLEEETSQQREDAFRKNMQRIEDIYRDHANDMRDAGLDYQQDLEDANRDWQRKQEDIRKEYDRKELDAERDHNQALIDAEQKYRDRLAELRRKYEFDAAEAIRQNDAVALLRLKRKLEFDLNEARLARDKEQQEERDALERKRQQRKDELARELEDSRIARDRKIEDITIAYQREIEELQKNLQRKLAEQKLALERELEEIEIAEERKREAINLAHERRIEDLNMNMQRELAILTKGLEAQVQVVEAASKRMAAAYANMAAVKAQSMIFGATGRTGSSSRYQNYLSSRGGRGRGGPMSEQYGDRDPSGTDYGTNQYGEPITPSNPYVPTPSEGYGRRFGGTVFPGMPVMVGEPRPGGVPNPEMFIPASLGRIVPWTGQEGIVSNTIAKQMQLVNRPPMSQQYSSYADNTNMQIDLSERVMDRFTPTQLRIIENVVAETMMSAKRRQGTRTRRF